MEFHWNPSSGSQVVPCGQTDAPNETNGTFSQFCEGASKNKTISRTNNRRSDLPTRGLWSATPALLTRMSTPPRLSLTHLNAVSISESLVRSHLTAYNLPVADCRDLDSSWDTVSIASVSMNMFYYIASCSLMQGYQHFTCWPFLHRMGHFTVSWQAIISLQPMTHQGLCKRLHVFIFRKRLQS